MLTITKLNATLYALFTMAMTFLCHELVLAGNGYLNDGFGLHPSLAYPIATLCVLLVIGAFFILFEEGDVDAAIDRAMDRASMNHPRCDVL